MNDLDRVKDLIGSKFDEEEIICALTDKNEEVLISNGEVKSNWDEYGVCSLHGAYYNGDNETIAIWVDDKDIIRIVE